MAGSSAEGSQFIPPLNIDDLLQQDLVQPADSTVQTVSCSQVLKPFSKSLKDLKQGLKMGSEQDVTAWLQSPLFQNHFTTYQKESLDPLRAAKEATGGQVATGASFREVLNALLIGEANGLRKYSRLYIDKNDWSPIDHAAYFLYHCTQENLADQNGVLRDKDFSEDAAYFAMWQAKSYWTPKSQKSRKERQKLSSERAIARLTDTLSSAGTTAGSLRSDRIRSSEDAPISSIVSPGKELTPLDQISQEAPPPRRTTIPSSVAGSNEHKHPSQDFPESSAKRQKLNLNGKSSFDEDEEERFQGSTEPSMTITGGLSHFEKNTQPLADNGHHHQYQSNAVNSHLLSRQHFPKQEDDDSIATGDISETLPDDDAGEVVTRTPEEIFKAEVGNEPFNLKYRHWRLATIREICSQDSMPKYLNEYASGATVGRDDIEYLNAHSQTWKKEVDVLQTKDIIAAAMVDENDVENFNKEEMYLNTCPEINVNLSQLASDLMLDGGDQPRLANMPRTTMLTTLQIVGIHSISLLRKQLRGALLADSMGLGKTLQMVGVVMHAVLERERAIQAKQTVQSAKPHLFIVPAHLVGQVHDEIVRFTEHFEVMVYFSDHRKKAGPVGRRVVQGYLHKDHDLFKSQNAARTIIVTSHATLNARHGPTRLTAWRVENGMSGEAAKKLERVKDPKCPQMLSGMFSIVCVDEAHQIKRADGQLSQAVLWLGAEFTLLATATPDVNSIADWKGYLPFVQPKKAPLHPLGLPSTDTTHNPYLDGGVGDVEPLLRLSPAAADQYIFNKSESLEAGAYTRKMQEQFVVRRTFGTKINGESVSLGLPKLFKRALDVSFSDEGLRLYREYAEPYLRNLIIFHRDTGRIIWNQACARPLIMEATWLGFEATKDDVLAHNVAKLKNDENLLRKLLLRWLAKNPGRFVVPAATDAVQLVKLICQDAPKIRCLLAILGDSVVRHKEKAVVWCTYPGQQLLVCAVLNKLQIDARLLSSDMDNTEREALIKKFNTQTSPEILVLSYSLSSCGLNLHKQCHITIHLDPPISRSIRQQADGRQRRIGAVHDVISWSISTVGTFNDRQYINSLNKALPGVLGELNSRIFDMSVKEDDDGAVNVDIGEWVLVDGHLARSNSETAREADLVERLSTEQVLNFLLDLEKGKKMVFK